MVIRKTVTVLALATGLGVGSGAMAQLAQVPPPPNPDGQPVPTLPAGLEAAIAAGDTATINAIVLANQGNLTVMAQIALALLNAATAAQNTNPTQAGILAAIAVNTQALQGDNQARALNIVGSSPTVTSLLTNPSAPNAGGNLFVSADAASKPIGLTTSGTQAAQNAAQTTENTAQTNGSRN